MTVLLLSGGLDSAVALAALNDAKRDVLALSVNYGQRHLRELEAAAYLAAYYQVPHLHVELPNMAGNTSALLTTQPLPRGSDQSATVVPGRNALLLAVAATVAVANGHTNVLFAAHKDDAYTYADCRPAFVHAMDDALLAGYGVHVLAPYLHNTKAQLVQLGASFGAPLAETWSCYEGGRVHCAQCGACTTRLYAFAKAGVLDGTWYA